MSKEKSKVARSVSQNPNSVRAKKPGAKQTRSPAAMPEARAPSTAAHTTMAAATREAVNGGSQKPILPKG